jgi:hypothetical protein
MWLARAFFVGDTGFEPVTSSVSGMGEPLHCDAQCCKYGFWLGVLRAVPCRVLQERCRRHCRQVIDVVKVRERRAEGHRSPATIHGRRPVQRPVERPAIRRVQVLHRRSICRAHKDCGDRVRNTETFHRGRHRSVLAFH